MFRSNRLAKKELKEIKQILGSMMSLQMQKLHSKSLFLDTLNSGLQIEEQIAFEKMTKFLSPKLTYHND